MCADYASGVVAASLIVRRFLVWAGLGRFGSCVVGSGLYAVLVWEFRVPKVRMKSEHRTDAGTDTHGQQLLFCCCWCWSFIGMKSRQSIEI